MQTLTKAQLIDTYVSTTAMHWIQSTAKRMKKLNRLELVERLRVLIRDLQKMSVAQLRDLIHNASQKRLQSKYSGYRARFKLEPETLKVARPIDTTGLRVTRSPKPKNKFAVLLPVRAKQPLVQRSRFTYATQVRRMVARLQE